MGSIVRQESKPFSIIKVVREQCLNHKKIQHRSEINNLILDTIKPCILFVTSNNILTTVKQCMKVERDLTSCLFR